MVKYRFTKEAAEDIYRIWSYTVDTWSEKQAQKYYSRLLAAFDKIAAKPLSYGKAYDIVYPGLRGEHVGRHIVFYFKQESKGVLIVRILHERMDYLKHL
ncbi:MAG: type II toxin-antitoxin system RelE/ParE family toxin [Bacteroidales bacterium]|nr:type II toxin-antitoxin system RelE/ParE family toxin [Bacteroidales bacterium]MBR3285787.1 type II toxin-antitoxin system RelE/ParE family toxin [Bacteroidales bacterium]